MIELEPKLKKIKNKILKYFPKQGSHKFEHTERIYTLAVRIAEKEGKTNIEVVKLAALLHNVARAAEGDHAIKGSKMAREILIEEGYGKQIIDHVCDCIETHRSSRKLEPRSIEGAILQDSDRLEMLGAIAIGRTFEKGAIKKRPMYNPDIPPSKAYPSRNAGRTSINRLKEKVLLITPDQFHSKTAKKLAKARYKFIQDFIDRFEKEWSGEL